MVMRRLLAVGLAAAALSLTPETGSVSASGHPGWLPGGSGGTARIATRLAAPSDMGTAVVPYVRWAGEKQVLTECFDQSETDTTSRVRFTFQSSSPSMQASLVPVTTNQPLEAHEGINVLERLAKNGCAQVIVFAVGEGAVAVDATLYTGNLIVDEDAADVFYLQFDHLDFQNTSPPSGTTPTGTHLQKANVHGYLEIPGLPSGRPATSVAISNAPSGSAGSYVLPAGRWVLPEDWPVLATFVGFNSPGAGTPSYTMSWDINSGYAQDQTENPVDCAGPTTPPALTSASGSPIASGSVSTGPCTGKDATGTSYSTAPSGSCSGITVGIGPFEPTQDCTSPFPLAYSPSGVAGSNSTYVPNGQLTAGDAPMPPALITFDKVMGPGSFAQVNKTAFYANVGGHTYPDPFYSEDIPASPLIPNLPRHGGYLWDTYGCAGRPAGARVHCGAAKGPYPFWQAVQQSPAGSSQPSEVSVYSDNHGEAVVALVVAPGSTGTIGTMATASYPYFRGFRPPIASQRVATAP